MGYYRGDYYRTRGDYYRTRGDLASFTSGLFSSTAAKLGNLLPNSWTVGGSRAVGAGIAGGAGALAAGLAAQPGLAAAIASTARSFISGCSTPTAAVARAKKIHGVGGASKRMNVTNSKALRRALRRVGGFGKLARRARRDIGRAATAVGVVKHRAGRAFGRKRAA